MSAEISPGFEMQDLIGQTKHYNGTISTSPTTLPAVADKTISEVIFKCPYQTPQTKTCSISFDGGTTYFTLAVGEFLGWSVKGEIEQVKIKGSTSGVTYDMLINYEEY